MRSLNFLANTNLIYMVKGRNNISLLIAPCGMNCALCLAYQREKNHCEGCRSKEKSGVKKCVIKNCANLSNNNTGFCYECDKFPCRRLKQLDKRYRDKYGMSMIENLESIKKDGLKEFLDKEKTKWSCSKCHELLCVHREECLNCQRSIKEKA